MRSRPIVVKMSRMPPRHSANVDLGESLDILWCYVDRTTVDSKRERVAKMQFSGILPEQAVNTAKLLVKLSVDRKMVRHFNRDQFNRLKNQEGFEALWVYECKRRSAGKPGDNA